MRILIVEDNSTYGHLVAQRLAQSGLDSDEVTTVQAARRAILTVRYAAVLLDLGLPDEDGIVLLRDMRSAGYTMPIMIVTARHSLEHRIQGLREGADDYLAKPFSMEELVARLHALLRRPGQLFGRLLTAGNVSLDTDNRQLKVGDSIQPMRVREQEVLELFIRNSGRVVSRRRIAERLFGLRMEQDANTLDVYIHRVRKVLADADATVKIHTIRGIGFLLSEGNGDRCTS
jgi:two-component system response regulator TctD